MNAREKRGRAKRESSTGKRVLIVLLVAVILLGGLGAAGAVLWSSYGSQISKALGWEKTDYEGSGTGSVVITIREGEIGSDIAASLQKQGVVKTSEAFYDLLLKQDPAVEFQVGSYQLKKQMSAKAALAALQDPKNQIKLTVTIPEGMAAKDALARIAKVTGIPQADFNAAVKDPSTYGIPKAAPSVEGFLFPATYTFEPNDTAETIVKKMVERMGQALREHGVPEADELRVLTLASIVQREAGSNQADFPKIARVFQNRLDQGMKLQSDATVAYGTGNTHTVWTTEAERADASNKYNTYANPGLPIGPIGLPGDVAIAAAMKPTPGKWLYFVPVNLETGETVFSETNEEHEAAVAKLGQWCEAHRAAGGKRCD